MRGCHVLPIAVVFVAAASVRPSVAEAQPAIIDSTQASQEGLVPVTMTVPVAAGTRTEDAARAFMRAADARGARAISRLSWVWIESDGRGTWRCAAPIVVRPERRDWASIGRRHCEPAAWMSPGFFSEIHGVAHLPPVGGNPEDMRALQDLLEPTDSAAPAAPVRRARPRPARRLSRRQIRALSRQLE